MIDLEKALLNPKVYDSKTKKVKPIKTSLSFVFFTDKFVYKIKQPVVRFGGKINYTTLASRKHAIFEEYKINKLFSSSIHIGIVPVQVNSRSNIGISNGGKTIDYALKIKRLPEKQELSELIRLRKIKNKDIILLANTLRKIHRELPRGKQFVHYASLRSLQQRWQEIFDWIDEPRMKRVVGMNFYCKLSAWYRKYFRSIQASLTARQSFAQRIHGDLNTENIFYVRGRFYFLDANQLLEEWGCGDPLNDVSAIAKDFDAYQQNDLGNLFVSSYLEGNNDAARSVVPFYKMYRTAIRYLAYVDILAGHPRKKWRRIDVARAKLYRTLVECYFEDPVYS